MNRRRRLVAALAATAAIALALSGCTLLPSPAASHRAESVSPELARFYGQTLKWSDCADGVDCTDVMSPLDWDKPTGATITVAVSRHKATGRPLGSLLMNPGGPGASGFDYVRDYAAFVVTPAVLAQYDVIGFDPRGVGHSTPVVCYTDPAQEDQHLYGTYDAPYGSQGWLDELAVREAKWTAACQAGTGDLLGHIDAASVARDMDLIRSLLGDTTLTYLGYSYGTYLGTMYAELFPTKVGRMVLDGAVDPQVSDMDALVGQMAGFDSAFRAWMSWCLKGASCPFSGSLTEALADAHGAVAAVDGAGIQSGEGRTLDSATVGTAVAQTLYSQDLWPNLRTMFTQLKHGVGDEAFAQADDYNGRSGGRYPENGNDVYQTVTCLEGDLGTDSVHTLDGLARIDEAAPIMGEYIALDDYAVLETACSHWPVGPSKIPAEFDARGAPPILVIGTTNDPATPYANSVSLAKQLSSGVLITHTGEGHTVYAQGNTCIDDTVDAYFLHGTVPKTDPKC